MDAEVKSIIEGGETYQIAFNDEQLSKGKLNGKAFEWDVSKIDERHYSIIKDSKSHQVEILKADKNSKSYFLKINGKKIKIKLEDRYDALLHKLGLEDLSAGKISNIKAPMPGLVIKIPIEVGQSIAIGEPIIVLEAMKMENVLKSPTEGIIKNIAVNTGDAVEKNQLLVEFE